MTLLKKIKKIGVLLSLCGATSGPALAGISIDSSRIVFHASNDSRGQSVGVTSAASSPQPYLVKAQVTRDLQGLETQTPFVVTPALFRLEPGSTNQVLVMKRSGKLPQDRESIFYFRSLAMPAGKKLSPNEAPVIGGTLKVATAAVIKLFYRPAGLKFSQRQAMGMLQFSRSEQGLKVNNPTPYYITLSTLHVAGSVVSLNIADGETLIAPFSHKIYINAPQQGKVEWKAINDFGATEAFYGTVR
ncbi:molecular chaperone [Serratia microhaemolytica]|uniref:fimbrial biogenesis chaperone n=1 Tax=Serratia microhaemolytica TaxID=2675110 RepID=UPI000FDD186B|nr:molecular chaperone [Serratia microhaemolytica]